MTLLASFLRIAITPARPPKIATNASRNVGVILANSSASADFNGVIKKKIVEVTRLTPKAIKKFFKDSFKLPRSFVPIDKPTPRMGPTNGDISIAPITTAVELLFNP